MIKMKKLLAIGLAAALTAAMSLTAFAAITITVDQDSTYAGTTGEAGRESFTYSQIFRLTKNGTSVSEGGGYDNDGTPGAVTPGSSGTANAFSYYLTTADDSARIAQLGRWAAATGTPGEDGYVAAHWEKLSGNLWFKLTPSADGSQYVVEWDNDSDDTDTVQAAAVWLAANYTPIDTGNLEWDSTNTKWTKTGLDEGYYLLKSITGNNLVAATGDINIREKNAYPPIDKTQADEDTTTQSNDERSVAVGDVLDYEVKVTIPATAAVNEVISVYDKPSAGLTYNASSMVITVDGTAVTPDDTGSCVKTGAAGTGEAWRYDVTVTAANKGKDVVFAFKMTVNSDALIDTGKENESGLKYGNSYNAIPDKVDYKTYYTGIIKIDGVSTSKLAEVEFTLKENGTEYKVTKHADGFYYPDAQGSATVKTNSEGQIIIRGLDNEKTYTLTETKTLPGYNLLDGVVTLDLYEDIIPGEEGTTIDTSTYTNSSTYGQVENYTGTVLPSTGGMGTTMFYVLGSILVVGAGLVLVSRRRMSMF